MRLVKPSYDVNLPESPEKMLRRIELAGRTCYKSEDCITEDSSRTFVRSLIRRGHESVLEHAGFSVRFVIDRGVSHELVRHRLCGFSQESTRYCNYGKAGQVTFVIPPWLDLQPGTFKQTSEFLGGPPLTWGMAMLQAEQSYLRLLSAKWTPQQARSVLPNSLKTEIVTTANLREWRHIMRLRTAKAAHPQMREIMIPLLAELKRDLLCVFEDIEPNV